MKKTIKKALSVCLLVCMVLVLLAAPAFSAATTGSYAANARLTINWSYYPDTKLLEITPVCTAAGWNPLSNVNATEWGAYKSEIEEIIIGSSTPGISEFGNGAIQSFPKLQKITIPAGISQFSAQAFNDNKSLREIVASGNAYVPGAADFTGMTGDKNLSTQARIIAGSAIEILILPGNVYSDEKPIMTQTTVSWSTTPLSCFPTTLETVMGPYGDAYLTKFAADNGYDYIPYGKIGEGTAWSYDGETKTATIYGNGTGSALDALSAEAVEVLKNATNLVIRADITSIADGAFAGLTKLENVTFEGNAPSVNANPFSVSGLTVTVASGADGFGDTWQGYTVSYPVIENTFIAVNKGTEADGAWKFDGRTETLYVWSNHKTDDEFTNDLYLNNLLNDESFKSFAGGTYGKYVKILNFRNEDGTVIVDRIEDGYNKGLGQLASLGLTGIEEIYAGGTVGEPVVVEFRRMSEMFQGLDALTTFGREGTAKGTVDLASFTFDGGASNGAFSAQKGIKKVTIPVSDTWGLAYDQKAKSPWANIPAEHFKGMTGLEEVVLNGSTVNKNNGSTDDTFKGAYYLGTCEIGANAFDGCTSLKSITIPAGAPASAVIRKSNQVAGGSTERSVKLFSANTFAGSSIEEIYILNDDQTVIADYSIADKAGLTIWCVTAEAANVIKADTPSATFKTLSNTAVVGGDYAVRYKSYNGLRSIYRFDNAFSSALIEKTGLTLVEYGAMIVAQSKKGDNALEINTLDPSFDTTVTGAIKRVVWKNGEFEGKVINHDPKANTEFALSLINYTGHWHDDVYSRAYAIYVDAYGEYVVAYADNGKPISFYDVIVSACRQGILDAFTVDEIAVWSVVRKGGSVDLDNAADGKQSELTLGDAVMMIAESGSEKLLFVSRTDGTQPTETDIKAAEDKAKELGITVADTVTLKVKYHPTLSFAELNGKSLREYALTGNLYNEDKNDRLAAFSSKFEIATSYVLPIVDYAEIGEYTGNYILLDDTNTDFSSYEIKIENGNLILYANYYTLDACIESLFSDILGYDLKEGAITGPKDVNITEGKKYNVEQSPIYSKEKLLSVLESVYADDRKLIIGQQINRSIMPIGEVFDWEVNNFKESCGTEVALYGYDIGSMLVQKSYNKNSTVKLAYEMIEYMRQGGMITLSVHIPNPSKLVGGEGAEKLNIYKPAEGVLGDGTVETWTDFMDNPDNTYRQLYLEYLEGVADFLGIFSENDAPIILRPFLEMNVNSAWWCMVNKGIDPDAEDAKTYFVYNPKDKLETNDRNFYVELWQEFYNYMVNGVETDGLAGRNYTNMLWEYSPNIVSSDVNYHLGVMDCYPGDAYVDLMAADWYTDVTSEEDNPDSGYNDGTTLLDRLESQYGELTENGKIFSFAEFGPSATRMIGETGTYTTDSLNSAVNTYAGRGVKIAYLLAWYSWDTVDGRVKLTIYEMDVNGDFYTKYDGQNGTVDYLDKAEVGALLYGE